VERRASRKGLPRRYAPRNQTVSQLHLLQINQNINKNQRKPFILHNVINLRIQDKKDIGNNYWFSCFRCPFYLECSEKYFVILLYKYILCDIIVVRGDLFVYKDSYQKICW